MVRGLEARPAPVELPVCLGAGHRVKRLLLIAQMIVVVVPNPQETVHQCPGDLSSRLEAGARTEEDSLTGAPYRIKFILVQESFQDVSIRLLKMASHWHQARDAGGRHWFWCVPCHSPLGLYLECVSRCCLIWGSRVHHEAALWGL